MGLLGLILPSASAIAQEEEAIPQDAEKLVGYFTAVGGDRRISWNPDAPTDDPFSFASQRTVLELWLDWQARARTAGGEMGKYGKSKIPSFEFVTDEFPRTVYLNVTNPVQVMVGLVPEGDSILPGLELEVLLEDRPFGGVLAWMSPYPYTPLYNATFSFWPQENVIHAGERLTFRFHLRACATYGSCRFGNLPPPNLDREVVVSGLALSGPRRTVVNFSLYPAYEVLSRYPDSSFAADFLSTDQNDPPANGGTLLSVGGLFFVALGASRVFQPPRGRPSSAFALSCLLATGISGCVGSSDLDSNPRTDGFNGTQTVNIVRSGGIGSHGDVLGLVRDTDWRPIRSAHVTLRDLPVFADTDARGRFVITNLAPARYSYRVDAPGHVTFEGGFEVVGGSTSQIEILMLRIEQEGSHPHDYWKGETARTFSLQTNVGGFFWPATSDFSRPLTVLPGTAVIEIRIDWEKARNEVERVGVAFQANDPAVDNGFTIRRETYFVGPGETLLVPTTYEMTDSGHQLYSTWDWELVVPAEEMPDRNEQSLTERVPVAPDTDIHRAIRDPFDLAFTIRSGSIPIESRHPEAWGGRDKLYLTNETQVPVDASVKLKELVPPGTGRLDVTLDRHTVVHDGPFDFLYRPANLPPDTALEDYLVAEGSADPDSANRFRYTILLAEHETDPHYAKQSNFAFGIRFPPDDVGAGVRQAERFANFVGESPSFVIKVVAYSE